MKQTIAQQEALQTLNNYYQYAVGSYLRRQWYLKHQKNLQALYGDQWTEELEEDMKAVGATPFVFNHIEPTVNAYLSLIINAKQKIAVKSILDIEKQKLFAEYINNFITSYQTQNDIGYKSLIKLQDAIIGGLGFSYQAFDPDSKQFIYERRDPRNVITDPDDQTLRLEESNFIGETYFTSLNTLIKRYPEYEDYFNNLIDNNNITAADIPAYNIYDAQNYNVWIKGRAIRIAEVYYKKVVTCYESTIDFEHGENSIEQQNFESFDLDYIKAKKSPGAKITEKKATQIWKGCFTENVLLEHGPIPYQTPNQKHFPLVPICLKRDYINVPVGYIDNLMPLALCQNLIMTKIVHGLNSKYLIISDSGFDVSKVREMWRQEMNRRDGMIITKDPGSAQLITTESLLPYLLQVHQMLDVQRQQITQLYDAVQGQDKSGRSGKADEILTHNSKAMQSPLHNAYEYMLKSEIQLLLDTMKGIKDFNSMFSYSQRGKLNIAVLNDEISTMNFGLYPEVAPNFLSIPEEDAARFDAIMQRPNYDFILSSPEMLTTYGFSEQKAYALHEAYMEQKLLQIDLQVAAQKALMQVQMQSQMQAQARQQQQQQVA